jgi:hypothetical protein
VWDAAAIGPAAALTRTRNVPRAGATNAACSTPQSSPFTERINLPSGPNTSRARSS